MADCEAIRIRLFDHYEGYARWWRPGSVRGAVLYLHGIQSHGLWFEASARRLAEAGLAVLLPDRRGSGRNDVERGHAASARVLLRDLSDYLDELHVRTGFDRFHIVAVSWGGKLALAFMRHARRRVASLTLVAPGLFPRVDLPLRQKARIALSAIAARRALIDIPLNEPALFTANPRRRQFIEADPLRLHQATVSFLLASRRLDRYARAVARDPVGCPVRLFLAGHDGIIDNEKTKAYFRRLAWPVREITEYDDAHHTLEFEPDPGTFLDDLVTWVTARANENA
jgi:alpha-beta hydrolase superfamily lysophospholipase